MKPAEASSKPSSPEVNGDWTSQTWFQYTTSVSAHNIRLVRVLPESRADDIRCELTTSGAYGVDGVATEGEPYTALSYYWGDQNERRQILLNGLPFMVTTNLHAALVALQSAKSVSTLAADWSEDRERNINGTWFWIDAICINQNDIRERNSQVRQMWRIFHGSCRVIAWFGQGGNDILALGKALRESSIPSISNLENSGCSMVVDSAFEYLLSCSYFTRTWIIPEVMQANKIVMRCGEVNLSWDEDFVPWLDPTGGAFESMYSHIQTVCMARRASTQALDVAFDLFYTYARTQCSDSRDKIFAMLGDPRLRALGARIQPKVDYNLSSQELWLAVMKQHFELMDRDKWHRHEAASIALEILLSSTLGVDQRSEAFSKWLVGQIDTVWSSSDAAGLIVTPKFGGFVLLSNNIHPMVHATFARRPSPSCFDILKRFVSRG